MNLRSTLHVASTPSYSGGPGFHFGLRVWLSCWLISQF